METLTEILGLSVHDMGNDMEKTIEQHRAEFQEVYTRTRRLPSDADLTQYDECFQLYKTWKAARGITE